MFGTKVKVFDKLETDMFPGGYHYHQHWDTIRDIVDGKSNAYLLHMSWTENKDNKLKFFRQMVSHTCHIMMVVLILFCTKHSIYFSSLVFSRENGTCRTTVSAMISKERR